MSLVAKDAAIPDTKLAKAITEYIRDTETELLFNHSSRVYHFGALAGMRRGLNFDRELLYAGAMFHDIGLMPSHSSQDERFEVDGAHAARDFLRSHGISEADAYTVWTAIALHTTPGVPQHMHSVVALVTAGVEMDVLGLTACSRSRPRRARPAPPSTPRCGPCTTRGPGRCPSGGRRTPATRSTACSTWPRSSARRP